MILIQQLGAERVNSVTLMPQIRIFDMTIPVFLIMLGIWMNGRVR